MEINKEVVYLVEDEIIKKIGKLLNETEITCKNCNGLGHKERRFIGYRTGKLFWECKNYCIICKGTGKLDWLDRMRI